MRTTSLYTLHGVSKYKTEKAVLFHDELRNVKAWLPLSVANVKFLGENYKVQITVPGWFYSKISWKTIEQGV